MPLFRIHLCLLICAGLFLTWNAHGQEIANEHFRIGKEVPFNTVYGKIVQDSLGHLWLGTDQGLYRYDGQEFHYFPGEATIIDEEILYFDFSADGTLWGMNLTNQILYLNPVQDSLRLSSLSDSVKDKRLELVSIRGNELQLLNRRPKQGNSSPIIYSISRSSNPEHPFDILKEKQEQNIYEVFTGSNKEKYKLRRLDNSNSILMIHQGTQVKVIDSINWSTLDALRIFSLPHKKKIAVYSPWDNKNRPPIYIYSTLAPYDKDSINTTNINRINGMFDDREGNTWICTDNGLIGYDRKYQALFNGRKLLAGRVVNNIFQDAEGAYWVGTERDGLYRLPNLNVLFYNSKNSILPSDNITVLTSGKEETLFGGTLASHLFQIVDNEIKTLYTFDAIQNNNLDIRAIVYEDDQLLIGLNNFQSLQFNLNTLSASPIKIDLGATKSIEVFGNKVIMGNNAGTYLLDNNYYSEKYRQISDKRNISLKIDSSSQLLWIGEIGGLKYYDFQNDTLLTFKSNKQTLSHFITDIDQDANTIIWVATSDNGIFGLRPDSLLFHFTTADGLLSNHCRKLMADGTQYLWIATDEGVNQIDLQTFEIQSIDRSDGLLIEEVTDLCRVDSLLWVGTTEGLFSLPVQKSYSSSQQPKIHFTKMSIWDRDTLLKDQYSLVHNANNLYIEFHSVDLRNREKMRYQYRMLGINSVWTITKNSINFARYPQLQPGSYRFEVLAINGEGISSKTATIQIEIQAPFWQTWWFRLTAVVLALGLFHFLSQNFRKRQARENQYKQRIEQLRSEALRAQMNPHFVFNTLNAIQYFLVQNNRSGSIKYLSKFAKLIRSIFEHSKYDKITLSEEIKFLENYLELEQLRFINRIDIHQQIDPQLRNSSVMVPPLLIQPLLENAFKHGLFHKRDKGSLHLSIREHKESIEIIIEDNGIGREKADAINLKKQRPKPYSSGSVIQERIDLLNSKNPADRPVISLKTSDLTDENGQACGTRCKMVIYGYI